MTLARLSPLALWFGCAEPTTTTPTTPPSPFALRFAAHADGAPVDCDAAAAGLGPADAYTVGLGDLRFYVSNVVFADSAGAPIPTSFDEDEFQYTGASGWVGLVDLTGTGGGCASAAEGTERVHDAITGTTVVEEVASVWFDVGVPQALMKEIIAENTPEGAPSPLNEMYWSWAMGYRHIVLDVSVDDGVESGEGIVHIGSTGCGAMGEVALESQDVCDVENTPKVALAPFDLASDTVGVDLAALFLGLDLRVPVVDPVSLTEIGDAPGVACHSSPSEEDCSTVLSNLGVCPITGIAEARLNRVFGVVP